MPGYSVQCPRFNPNGTYLIWLQNPVGGPHGQCVSLVGTQWPMNCLKPEVIMPIINSPCSDYKCTIDRFPGNNFVTILCVTEIVKFEMSHHGLTLAKQQLKPGGNG